MHYSTETEHTAVLTGLEIYMKSSVQLIGSLTALPMFLSGIISGDRWEFNPQAYSMLSLSAEISNKGAYCRGGFVDSQPLETGLRPTHLFQITY